MITSRMRIPKVKPTASGIELDELPLVVVLMLDVPVVETLADVPVD